MAGQFIDEWDSVFMEESQKVMNGEMYEELTDEKVGAVYNKLMMSITEPEPVHLKQKKRFFLRYGIAASLLIGLLSVAFFLFKRDAAPDHQKLAYQNDVAPGKYAAVLTLAGGRQIRLDDQKSGQLATESGVVISKATTGEISYRLINPNESVKAQINMLSTGNGETYRITLPDGTRVWLNSASTIKYPASFNLLKKRAVELKGEAYFEVAKDRRHPFMVKTEKQEIEVLGTHFNVMAYPEEKDSKTTLLEGAVKIKALHSTKFLLPGQQAIVSAHGIALKEHIDLEEAIAWKDGDFKFNGDLESIMYKISRWYGVEVSYADHINKSMEFEGKMSRSRNLSSVLKVMELTGRVHFNIEGRRVIVKK